MVKARTNDGARNAVQQAAFRQGMATRGIFFIAGFGLGSWAPLVPFAQERSRLDDGSLGLVLLCLGAGSIFATPATRRLADRFGYRSVIAVATICFCALLPLLATVALAWELAVVLLSFGAAIGTIDVAMNLQAVAVEKASGRVMMSGFHGLHSLGSIAGASAISGMMWLGSSPLVATLTSSGLLVALLLVAAPGLLGTAKTQAPTAFALPRGKVILVATLCFVGALAEGSMLDWSAVFLSGARGVAQAQAGLGYAAFASAMSVGRLGGDRIVQRIGARRVLVLSGAMSCAGYVLVVAAPGVALTLASFCLIGLGISNVIPVLMTEAGRQSAMPSGAAVSAVIVVCYAGVLAGPSIIGLLARITSLSAAFLIVAAMTLPIALYARPATH